MSLSLCMIVKDEEDNLPRCLDSIKNVADEIIIVDTGSTDSTVQIAESYGAKVHFFPWNDSFSDARNESLKHATCEWILIMDADDELESADKEKLLELVKASDIDAYIFETISYMGDTPGNDIMMNLNLRLFRNGKGYFYSQNVHEQLQSNILAVNPKAIILTEHIRFHHYGYMNKNVIQHKKRARNISLLEMELEKNPGNPFILFNLASEYFAESNNMKALELFERAYTNFNPSEGFSPKLVLKMASCYINLRRYDNALKFIDENMIYYPGYTDLIYLKGLACKWQGKQILAIKHFKKCIEMGEAPIHYNVIIGAGNFKSFFELGEIYFEHEDYESAVEFYSKALEHNQKFSLALPKLIKALCRKKQSQEALEKGVELLKPFHRDNYALFVSELLMEEKYYNLALKYVKKHEKAHSSSALSKYKKGLCNLYLKKYKQAFKTMASIKTDAEFGAAAVCCQALCRILLKEYSKANAVLNEDGVDRKSILVKVYQAFTDIIGGGPIRDLCEGEEASPIYTRHIFDILKVIINVYEFELFEKSLQLLNTVNDKTVFLRLAKLYYHSGSLGLAYQELLRSIQVFNVMDCEGAGMLYRLKLKGL